MCPLLWIVGTLLILPGFRTAAQSLQDASSKKDLVICFTCANNHDYGIIRCGEPGGLAAYTFCPLHDPECTPPNSAGYIVSLCRSDNRTEKSFRFLTDRVTGKFLVAEECREIVCNGSYRGVKVNTTDTPIFTDIETTSTHQVLLNNTEMKFNKTTQVPLTTSNETNGNISTIGTIDKPQAEPLKQNPSASEDDEDEGEGSGASEEFKNKRLASSASDPSSYLPAQENKAAHYTARNMMIAVAMSIMLL